MHNSGRKEMGGPTERIRQAAQVDFARLGAASKIRLAAASQSHSLSTPIREI
jgi:hypothetical protein